MEILILVGLLIVSFEIHQGFQALNAKLDTLAKINDNIQGLSIINNSVVPQSVSSNKSLEPNSSSEDLEALKELAQFNKASENVNIKLNLDSQSKEMDSSSQDALKFLKKKQDQ